MMRALSLWLAVGSIALTAAAGTATVVDTYHGVKVGRSSLASSIPLPVVA